MYEAVLLLHSWVRWAVVAAALTALVASIGGRRSGLEWRRGPGLVLVSAMDLQLLLGLALLAVSPIPAVAFADMKAAMKDPTLRFFAVEHPTAMIAATALVHVGFAKAKRATEAAKAWQAQVLFFSIAMLLVLASIPWPFRAIGRTLLRLP